MENHVRPLSRVAAVELTDCEVDSVSGGFPSTSGSVGQNTDVYCSVPNSNAWKYDYTKTDE